MCSAAVVTVQVFTTENYSSQWRCVVAEFQENWLKAKKLIFLTESVDERNKEDRHHMNNITLLCVGVTVVAINHNNVFCFLPHFLTKGVIFWKKSET